MIFLALCGAVCNVAISFLPWAVHQLKAMVRCGSLAVGTLQSQTVLGHSGSVRPKCVV